MGIEALSGITGAAAYQVQSTPAPKPVAEVKKPEQIDVQAQPVVDMQTAAVAQVESGEQGGSANYDQQKNRQPDESKMKDVAKDINKLINQNTIAEFGYHEETHRITIKIKDKDTDEIIKEIPSEKALEMLKKAWEIAGILVDEKR